jgi:hypothetical protein
MVNSKPSKSTTIQTSTLLPLGQTEVIEMTRDTAVKLIQDLVQDLSRTGIRKEVFRTNENKWLVFKVKD